MMNGLATSDEMTLAGKSRGMVTLDLFPSVL